MNEKNQKRTKPIRFRQNANELLWQMKSIQGSAALVILEEYLNGALLQLARIQKDKARVVNPTRMKMSMPANVALFMDIHFYFITLDRFRSLLEAIVKEERSTKMNHLWRKYCEKLSYVRIARNHLEHIEERIYCPSTEYWGDLGNLRGDSYTFGGRSFDVSEKPLIIVNEAYDDLLAILSEKKTLKPDNEKSAKERQVLSHD